VAPSFGIMADFIEPTTYSTNVASFRTADSYTYIVNDACTFTLANSFTDTYSPIPPPAHHHPAHHPDLPTISFSSDFIFDLGTRPR